jgi:agmatine deiminase
MPAETSLQARVWMAFPPTEGYDETAEETEAAVNAWCAVANAIVAFEPVTMLVEPDAVSAARSRLDERIEFVEAPLDDAWLRDIGPTFVHAMDGVVAAIAWRFNGWGQQPWTSWERDSRIGSFIAGNAGVPLIESRLVNEGGGIVCDGYGTVVVTETVQLDPLRNPDWSKTEVEAELARLLGARQVIWLKLGLTRDSERYGTKGHADIVVSFPARSTVLIHTQRNPEHPDYEISREVRAQFERATDADGNPWRIVELPAPDVLTDDEGFVDYSYINHLPVNGAVIACAFDDPRDDEAMQILASVYPGREIVPIDARPIFARGGGIHCITQQQPK